MQPDEVANCVLFGQLSRSPGLTTRQLFAAIRWPIVNIKSLDEDCAPFVKGTASRQGLFVGRNGPAARVRAFLATDPCGDMCPGWFVDGELGILTRCDECVTNAGTVHAHRAATQGRRARQTSRTAPLVYDPTILLLPEALLELCRETVNELTQVRQPPGLENARRRREARTTERRTAAAEITDRLTVSILRSACCWRGEGLDWQCRCGVGVRIADIQDPPVACAACGTVFVDRLAPLVGLFVRQCVEHEDCRGNAHIARACWLKQGEAWAHLTDPRL